MSTPQPVRDEVRGEGQLLQSLVAHWIHEDQLYWMQVRHLLGLELAVLGALFALKVTLLSAALMFFAAVVSTRFGFLAEVIRQNRNSNVKTIALVSRNVASSGTQNEVRELMGVDQYNKWGILRIARHDLDLTDAGKWFQIQIFVLCTALNVALGIAVTHDLNCQQHWLERLQPSLIIPARHQTEAQPGAPANGPEKRGPAAEL